MLKKRVCWPIVGWMAATGLGCRGVGSGSHPNDQAGNGVAAQQGTQVMGVAGNAHSGQAGAVGGIGIAGRTVNDAGTGGAAARGGAGSAPAAGSSGTSGAAGKGAGGSAGMAAAGSVAVAGAAGSATQACSTSGTAKPGDVNKSVMVGSLQRTYVMHVPSGYTASTPVPVVIDFHPLGGTGANWKGSSGWGSLADSKGFIVVWPDGYQNAWNVGRCCPPASDQKIDDIAFVRALIKQLAADACIDVKRVYATGCSNGGGMSYKVACEAADAIAAVAPVDFDCVVGPMNVPSCGGCTPARPISETQFRATSDQAVAYNGGPAPIPRGMDFPGAKQNFTDWAKINQCTGSPQTLANHPACQTYEMCAGGAQTTLCTQQGGSHCGNYQALGIVNIAWEMFQKQVLP